MKESTYKRTIVYNDLLIKVAEEREMKEIGNFVRLWTGSTPDTLDVIFL